MSEGKNSLGEGWTSRRKTNGNERISSLPTTGFDGGLGVFFDVVPVDNTVYGATGHDYFAVSGCKRRGRRNARGHQYNNNGNNRLVNDNNGTAVSVRPKKEIRAAAIERGSGGGHEAVKRSFVSWRPRTEIVPGNGHRSKEGKNDVGLAYVYRGEGGVGITVVGETAHATAVRERRSHVFDG